ncbi:hypothetical protein N9341_01060 [Candidatus Pelagibacter sp.]|nr:hypothetical protein [Candidatus Pelagibacter sp.]
MINFEAKFLYFLWKLKNKNKDSFKLGNNDALLIKNNQEFKSISQKILNNLNERIKKVKDKLLSEEHRKEMIEKYGENNTDAFLPYRISIWEDLDENLRKEIVQFASSNKMISTAANHMKVFPILTRVQVSLNVPRENSDLRGAMYWHKDTFGFKNLDFFMYVNDVDDENAPFHFLKEKIQASVFMKFEKMRPFNLSGERGKVDISEFSKFYSDESVQKTIGDSGTAVFLDSFSTFHRGGYCKSKDRIALRFCYQSHDAFYEEHTTNTNHYKYDKNLSTQNIKSVFLKYLYFKKKTKLMKLFSSILLKMYWKISYYV